jgi:hypothetical protein
MWNILGRQKFIRELSEILKRRDHFEDIHGERKILLKLIIRTRSCDSGVDNSVGPPWDSIFGPSPLNY